MRLELKDVSCGYDPKHPILENVTFDLNSGDVCCLLGPNGVGKSTLFKTILHLLPVMKGTIAINGESMENWSARRVSEHMAYVEQAHIPTFPYEVKDIAMLGRMGQISALGQPSKRDQEIVEKSLDTVGIRHLRRKIYTDISGGERQLLMIARALAQEPKILVLDEPTANLDYGNMVKVMECIRHLARRENLCVIFTTHIPDQAFMTNAKTVFLFRDDPLVVGPAEKVITEKNLYKAYHANIQILEIMDKANNPIRICTPRFDSFFDEMERPLDEMEISLDKMEIPLDR